MTEPIAPDHDPHEPDPHDPAPRGPSGGRRGRGRPRGDAAWGDAIWVEAPSRTGGPRRNGGPTDSGDAGTGGDHGEAPRPREEQDLVEKARAIALRHLTGAPRSRQQLEQRLADREIPVEIAREVLDRLAGAGLVDDEAFAQAWVRSRHSGRRLSRTALRRELREKGVDQDLSEQALQAVSDEDERNAALEVVRRRVAQRPVPAGSSAEERAERDKHVRRLVAMLGRRGYGPSLAFAVVHEVLADAEA